MTVAIVLNITTDAGITIESAYARIDSFNGSKETVDLTVHFYVDQTNYLNGRVCAHREQHSFVPSVEETSDNFIKQGYEYLKTLAAFADSVDA